jgi:hypothetical protein
MLTIESVKDIRWANEAKTAMIAMVKFKEFDQEIPYGINDADNEDHGIELFNKAKSMVYGEPSAYIPYTPPVTTPAQKLSSAGLSIDELKTLLGLA